MRTTVSAYKRQLERAAQTRGITDMRCQINAWPYPQACNSHIAIWRDAQKVSRFAIPENAIRIAVVNSDCQNMALRIAEGEPTATEAIKQLLSA